MSQGVAWSYSEEHTREIQRRETVESAPTRTASLRSEATQHHLATTPRGARVVAFSRVVAPLGGAQVHRVEIGEGKHKRSRRENLRSCSAIVRTPRGSFSCFFLLLLLVGLFPVRIV